MSRRQRKRTMPARDGYESRNPQYVRHGIWQDRDQCFVQAWCEDPRCVLLAPRQSFGVPVTLTLAACIVTQRSRAPSFDLEPLSRRDAERLLFVKLVADQHRWETGHHVTIFPDITELAGKGRCLRR